MLLPTSCCLPLSTVDIKANVKYKCLYFLTSSMVGESFLRNHLVGMKSPAFKGIRGIVTLSIANGLCNKRFRPTKPYPVP